MKIISSQRYIDGKIVDEKIVEISGQKEVVLPAWIVGGDMEDMAVLADGHHRLEAANQLGIPVRFEFSAHPEGLTGELMLETMWMDSDYYDIDTGKNVW